MQKMSLEEQIAVFLVWDLPENTTLTVNQIKEITPVIARFVGRLGMNKAEANAYERIKDYIEQRFPKTLEAASKECGENNCHSMATVLVTTIEKLTGNIDKEWEES
jgi:hypothetical protein